MTVIELHPGQRIPLTAYATLPDGYNVDFSTKFNWVSSSPVVATVTSNSSFSPRWVSTPLGGPGLPGLGDNRSALISALSVGTTTITCTGGPFTKVTTIVVTPTPLPTSIKIAAGDIFDPTQTQNHYD